jgi:hypothetical protein
LCPASLYQGEEGPPASKQILQAFSLADRIGIKPSCEVIRSLNATIAAAATTLSTLMDINEDEEDPHPTKKSRHSHRKEIMAPPAKNWDEEDIVDVYGSEYGVDDEITQMVGIDVDSKNLAWGLPIVRQVDPILDFISHYS